MRKSVCKHGILARSQVAVLSDFVRERENSFSIQWFGAHTMLLLALGVVAPH